MAARYPDSVKDAALRLWLAGQTDAQIAAALDIRRADTVRDWRREGGWDRFKEVIDQTVCQRVAALRAEKVYALNERHDSIGAAIEQQAVRQLRALAAGGRRSPADLRAIAAAMLSAQRLRRTALGADTMPPPPEHMARPRTIVWTLKQSPRPEDDRPAGDAERAGDGNETSE